MPAVSDTPAPPAPERPLPAPPAPGLEAPERPVQSAAAPEEAMQDDEAILADLVEEFQERYHNGEPVSVESFAAQHPDMEEELLSLLPAVVDMDSLGRISRPPAPAMANYPEQLGDYHLLNKLGSGGMGTVFRAMQESLKREVAVKVLAPAWSADARHSEAFENESRLIAGLRHTNIVEVYGAGQEGHYRYYVMALVNGRGLSAGLLGRCFPGGPYHEAVARVGYQAARALAFAHAHGVLHRDVKPGNLLLDDEGVIHVSDFGLATALNAGENAPLVTQSLEGTLRYMAPERLMKGVNSFAGDQYSLGLTLYELITRAPAFNETEPGKLIHTICNNALPPLRHEGELGAIINKAISYSEQDRYASLQDMADDLRRYLDGKPVKARPATLLRRYMLWVRRRPAVAAWSHAAALLVMLLFASICWGYASVSRSLRNENEQRLLAENNAKLAENNARLAENNAQIADAALLRIFTGMSLLDKDAAITGDDSDSDTYHVPSPADARLMQDLMPYYEEIAAQAEQGDSKVSQACRILADISLQAGEYETAETYYRRILEMETAYSPAAMAATNGLASALFSQNKAKAAQELLETCVKGLPADASFETRLAAVHSLQLATGYGNYMQVGGGPGGPGGWRGGKADKGAQDDGKGDNAGNGDKGDKAGRTRGDRPDQSGTGRMGQGRLGNGRLSTRYKHMEQAATLLAELLKERPDDTRVLLRRVEILSSSRSPKVHKLLAPNGEPPEALLKDLLEKDPDSREFQLAYVRLSMRNDSRQDSESLKTAAHYAGNLLAEHPADSEYIMLYLGARDRYTADLAAQGKEQEAAKENERTIGVLSFLTSRADFSPEVRERLIDLVSHRPAMGQDSDHRDEELRTLLRDYDESRMSSLRTMIRQRRERFQRPGQNGNRPLRPVRPGVSRPAKPATGKTSTDKTEAGATAPAKPADSTGGSDGAVSTPAPTAGE